MILYDDSGLGHIPKLFAAIIRSLSNMNVTRKMKVIIPETTALREVLTEDESELTEFLQYKNSTILRLFILLQTASSANGSGDPVVFVYPNDTTYEALLLLNHYFKQPNRIIDIDLTRYTSTSSNLWRRSKRYSSKSVLPSVYVLDYKHDHISQKPLIGLATGFFQMYTLMMEFVSSPDLLRLLGRSYLWWVHLVC